MTTNPISIDRLIQVLEIRLTDLAIFNPTVGNIDHSRDITVLNSEFKVASELINLNYDPAKTVKAVDSAWCSRNCKISELSFDDIAWFLPYLEATENTRSLEAFQKVIQYLFSPEGCPWDNAQTAQSLRHYLIEETYELVDAIDHENEAEIMEEIGDLLAHMFMQTAIAEKNGYFTIHDVVQSANQKYVRRHPHVFTDEQQATGEPSLEGTWEAIKKKEREQRDTSRQSPESALESVPFSTPSLSRSQQVLRRADKEGIHVELVPNSELLTDEKLLFSKLLECIVAANSLDIDLEEILRDSVTRFISEFKIIETLSAGDMSSLGKDEKKQPWEAMTDYNMNIS